MVLCTLPARIKFPCTLSLATIISFRSIFVFRLYILFLHLSSASMQAMFSDDDFSMEELRLKLNRLRRAKNTVVEMRQHMAAASNQSSEWLQRVEECEAEVDEILRGDAREIEPKLCRCCFPLTSRVPDYRLRIRVAKERQALLLKESEFYNLLWSEVQVAASDNVIVGLDMAFKTVWGWLKDDRVGNIGIFGMRGVGKTALLKKIKKELVEAAFPLVVWVSFAKYSNIRSVQAKIGHKLGLSWPENASRAARARDIFSVLRKKKFVLLLDGIAEEFSLSDAGVPYPSDENKSKLLLTTRSEDVCRRMGSHKMIEVKPLAWEEAWELFRIRVGDATLDSNDEIRALAEIVAKDCNGLPLALNAAGQAIAKIVAKDCNDLPLPPVGQAIDKTVVKDCNGLPLALNAVGQAMASERKPNEWVHARKALEESASDISTSGMASKRKPNEWMHATKALKESASDVSTSGMVDEVFPLLKLSYDSLENDQLRSCFLYCALFPEDHSIKIEEIIHYWSAEGFLDLYNKNMNENRRQGYAIIASLKMASLLESGEDEMREVKMLSTVRNFAFWIASECWTKRDRFLVEAGVGLTEAPGLEEWEKAERISLMDNNILRLIEAPQCPTLLTLILKNNNLKELNSGFFQFMHAVRVLDLSWCKLCDFPLGIVNLIEMQYLNLSHTNITRLPIEFKKLVKLKILDLSYVSELDTIPAQVISKFSKLQVLNVYCCGFRDWVVEGDDISVGSAAFLKEVESLNSLDTLGINIKGRPAIDLLFSSHKLQSCTHSLSILGCRDLISFPLSSIEHMRLLNMLHIGDCVGLKDIKFSGECFPNLGHVKIEGCWSLKDLTWVLFFPSIQSLDIERCMSLEEVICGSSTGKVEGKENLVVFSRLKYLYLRNLPELRNIYTHALPFPSLEEITVVYCPKLRKLPLDSESGKTTLKLIKGQRKWWNELEMDEEIKSTFLPSFLAIE